MSHYAAQPYRFTPSAKAARYRWNKTPRGKLIHARNNARYELRRTADPDRAEYLADIIKSVTAELERFPDRRVRGNRLPV